MDVNKYRRRLRFGTGGGEDLEGPERSSSSCRGICLVERRRSSEIDSESEYCFHPLLL